MKKYRVLIPALLLKNNAMAKFGEEVTEVQLTDSVENLVNGKYIEEILPPSLSAADLQAQADEAKAKELADAQSALDAAVKALDTAKANATAAAPELKAAADEAVANAQKAVDAAQSAVDALKPKKK